jgi:hypothetical protein
MAKLRYGLLAATLLAAAGCSDDFLQPKSTEPTNLDNRLTLRGRVCTAPPDPAGFPVKVVMIVDQSGSMCVSDPPGSQGVAGFCEQVGAVIAPNVFEPARVRALKRLVAQFQGQQNLQVALVPFETNIKGDWPGMSNGRFAPANAVVNGLSLTQRINSLQSELGKGTDYQGALSYAHSLILADINAVEQSSPQLLPRTRYVVVFLTDGTPFPRCSANDNLSAYADASNPDLIWEDSSGAGGSSPTGFCNGIDPMDPDAILGYVKGTDRNQNYQLFNLAQKIMELKDKHNIGDIRMHSVLLFNVAAVAACGPICQDIYGTYPNTPPAQYPVAARTIAEFTLRRLAEIGNGVYQAFENGEIQNLGLGALDYSGLAARNVMKNLIVKAMSSAPGDLDRVEDADGDGLPDSVDNDFSNKTNLFFSDSDEDAFDDGFEVMNYDKGFRASVKDTRGCDRNSPLTPGCFYDRDTDGDGLTNFAEDYLHTRNVLVDTDGDGVPDGIETRYGMDPLVAQAPGLDTDGDGYSDLDEIRFDSSPIRRDRPFIERNAYQYETTPEIQPGGQTICYDFSVSNLQLVTPPKQAGLKQGYNLFKIFFDEAPESGVATDYGVWRAACAWAQYDPPGIRVPSGPDITFTNADFRDPRQLATPADLDTRCLRPTQ